MTGSRSLRRQEESIIIHFDYDCFYASVVENETPALKALPLAIQQKQIVVTCNYEARRRGLYKMQLIKDAKKVCPDVVIVLGEDLTRFRNASKDLYSFLRAFSWNDKVERLGFDEVFMDVSDIVNYNAALLNPNALDQSFLCLSKEDPTDGFNFDARYPAGQTYPENDKLSVGAQVLDPFRLRLHIGSHLARHLRHQLDQQKGYTCTVGISTSKMLSKLVGNLHKPQNQTTLMPPYNDPNEVLDSVTEFIDAHEIGKIPGVGFKLAYKIREHVLRRTPEFNAGLVYGGTKENVLAADVRKYPGMNARTLDNVLGGPGTPQGIGAKIWGLINGVDDAEVGQARVTPKQISQEDSYLRLDTMDQVLHQLRTLSKSLIHRMHTDLLEEDGDTLPEYAPSIHIESPTPVFAGIVQLRRRWLAQPRTLRLTTRPRPAPNPDGSRSRSFNRISRSMPMPNFVFNLNDTIDVTSEKLVMDSLVPLFRKLHPEKSGWNLTLINLAVTNMADTASDSKGGNGRDISKMFKNQDEVLKQWRLDDRDSPPDNVRSTVSEVVGANTKALMAANSFGGSEDLLKASQDSVIHGGSWDSEEDESMEDVFQCTECDARMPIFAMVAHSRWHSNTD